MAFRILFRFGPCSEGIARALGGNASISGQKSRTGQSPLGAKRSDPQKAGPHHRYRSAEILPFVQLKNQSDRTISQLAESDRFFFRLEDLRIQPRSQRGPLGGECFGWPPKDEEKGYVHELPEVSAKRFSCNDSAK